MIRQTSKVVATLVVAWLLSLAAPTTAQEKLRSVDLAEVKLRVEQLEDTVEKADGRPLELDSITQGALKKLAELIKKHPDHPVVKDLFERAKVAYRQSKGQMLEITPEILAYRDREKQVRTTLAELSREAWGKYKSEVASTAGFIEKPFPAPDHAKISFDDLEGKLVVLEGFQYPKNEFRYVGSSYVYVGSPTRGYYFVEAGSRSFLGPYEAVKRYRRQATSELPESWTLVGKITDIAVMVPQADKVKTVDAQWGWVVEPVAIYVPDIVLALVDPESEAGGSFVGEDRIKRLLREGFTVTSIPDDVTPEDLVQIMITAIKEKNFDLYLECIDPEKRVGPIAIHRLRYLWDSHQDEFVRFYVHAEAYKVEDVITIQGAGKDKDLDDLFLEEKDRADLEKHDLPKIEEVVVWLRYYDENGRMVRRPAPCTLRRVEEKRWYVRYGY